MIAELSNRLIDEWIDEGQVEFVSRFALPLPIMVITSLLGLPLEDIPQLKVWSEAWVMPFARGLTDAQELYVAEQGVQFQRYLHDHVERKRRHPGDDDRTSRSSCCCPGSTIFAVRPGRTTSPICRAMCCGH